MVVERRERVLISGRQSLLLKRRINNKIIIMKMAPPGILEAVVRVNAGGGGCRPKPPLFCGRTRRYDANMMPGGNAPPDPPLPFFVFFAKIEQIKK